MTRLPPLEPAVARTRLAVRRALADIDGDADAGGLVLVALSGGADSLALAAAVAFEARNASWRAGAVIVDHGLQTVSTEVAAAAAEQAERLGLSPVITRRVTVELTTGEGAEAAARNARYAALEEVRSETGAAYVLTAHTLDDQAEQVLLAIARGSGTRSLAGIPPVRERVLRPFLFLDASSEHTVDRATTLAACAAQGLTPWHDPMNRDHSYTRVRVREKVIPNLEQELGPGVARSLARTAELAREDADALDAMVEETIEEIVTHAEAGITVSVRALAANPAALRHRIIRRVAEAEFGAYLTREHTLQIAALVTDWRGQGPISVPGISVRRVSGEIRFTRGR